MTVVTETHQSRMVMRVECERRRTSVTRWDILGYVCSVAGQDSVGSRLSD